MNWICVITEWEVSLGWRYSTAGPALFYQFASMTLLSSSQQYCSSKCVQSVTLHVHIALIAKAELPYRPSSKWSRSSKVPATSVSFRTGNVHICYDRPSQAASSSYSRPQSTFTQSCPILHGSTIHGPSHSWTVWKRCSPKYVNLAQSSIEWIWCSAAYGTSFVAQSLCEHI